MTKQHNIPEDDATGAIYYRPTDPDGCCEDWQVRLPVAYTERDGFRMTGRPEFFDGDNSLRRGMMSLLFEFAMPNALFRAGFGLTEGDRVDLDALPTGWTFEADSVYAVAEIDGRDAYLADAPLWCETVADLLSALGEPEEAEYPLDSWPGELCGIYETTSGDVAIVSVSRADVESY